MTLRLRFDTRFSDSLLSRLLLWLQCIFGCLYVCRLLLGFAFLSAGSVPLIIVRLNLGNVSVARFSFALFS